MVVTCRLFRASHSTNMSHQGHRVWGVLQYSSTITVSRTCLCRKCTLISNLVSARPLHPSTGNSHDHLLVGKSILYFCGSPSGVGVSHCHMTPASIPCCVFRCTASNPTANSSPHSEHFTLTLCLSCYVNLSTLICHLYDVSGWVPYDRQGGQTIPTVFPMSVHSPTLSNIPARV